MSPRIQILTYATLALICASENIEDLRDVQSVEYCQHETMNGRCRWKSEVIVMTSARWGRMKTGRCLDIHPNALAALGHDPMFLGCSADVLSLVNKKCSGNSECDIRIPDPDLDTVTPCYPDQKSYLEASYTCVKVVQESRSCVVSITADQQFISRSTSYFQSESSTVSGCGSRSHPWRLEAPVGQRIEVSLLDFIQDSSQEVQDNACHQSYGYIIERANKKNKTICASSNMGGVRKPQEVHVYTTNTSSADVIVTSGSGSHNFLLKVNAIGCTNMIPPDNAWLKRHNNDIIIGCYLSQQTWQLKCDGHEWKGQVGTCPETFINTAVPVEEESIPVQQPRMFLITTIIAGGSIIICFAVVAIGVMCFQRWTRAYKKSNCLVDEIASGNYQQQN